MDPVTDFKLRTTLYDSGKKIIKTFTSEKFSVSPGDKYTVRISDDIKDPAKWSAEFPNLYTLLFELMNASGRTIEVINGRFGFKKTEIRNQVSILMVFRSS